MGFFKCLAYVAGGLGAVVLAPMTGGSSIALAIGALGTTTAAGAVIGAGVGVAAAAIDHANSADEDGYKRGVEEGTKAGESIATTKYEEKKQSILATLKEYKDIDNKLVAMYAIGLAVANSDGYISQIETEELESCVAGLMAGNLSEDVKTTIVDLSKKPPSLTHALKFAAEARLPRKVIDDIIDLVANADDKITPEEEKFIDRWMAMSLQYEIA